MGWWESFAVTVTLLTVFARLRSKRSAPGEPNSQHYSRYSPPTEARQTLFDPDHLQTDRTYHISWCQFCNEKSAIPLSLTSLERRPWRVVWQCPNCSKTTSAAVPERFVDEFLDLDRAGGMRISIREIKAFDKASIEDLTRAVAVEL